MFAAARLSHAQLADAPDGLLRLDYRSARDGRPDWALLLPPAARGGGALSGADRPARDLPTGATAQPMTPGLLRPPPGGTWILCLHGHGSAGDQLYKRGDLRAQWLPRFRALGCGILTPNLRGNAWMGPAAADDLRDLLAWTRRQQDAARFVFFSGSMGGAGNLIYAALHPEDAAAVVALCPASDLASYHAWCRARPAPPVLQEIADALEVSYGGPPAIAPDAWHAHSAVGRAERLTMPLCVIHGDADAVIPVAQARALRARLDGRPSLRYEDIPRGGHDSPLPRLDALDWVLARLP